MKGGHIGKGPLRCTGNACSSTKVNASAQTGACREVTGGSSFELLVEQERKKREIFEKNVLEFLKELSIENF